MSQSDVSKAEAADQRSEQTRSFVRRVRAATRRKYTPEEKIRIVLEGFRRGIFNRCVNSQAVYPLSEQDGLKAQERRYTAYGKEKH